MTGWLGAVQRQLDLIQTQWPHWPPWHFKWKWPWKDADFERQRLKEEYERKREQVEVLCKAVKVDTLADLQDLLGAMVLSECVYKKPDVELVRAVNKFKSEFGGQLVSLHRVQASLEHVPHRYLLAEAGDTLFASFVGTNHYKDVIADVNVLQGAIFHDDADFNVLAYEKKDAETQTPAKGLDLPAASNSRNQSTSKPAAHRGFLGRAKGIPALEIYQLAQKKNQKLVLCGHSLGGAVAVLTTLAILRAFASISGNKISVKCITFSQPPVGNRALRDYVHRQGWQQHFRTYCIPEDVIPRILSPAYFQHYHEGGVEQLFKDNDEIQQQFKAAKKDSEGERMALGLGPVQTSFWRIPKLVPLVSVAQIPMQWFKGKKTTQELASSDGGTDLKSRSEGLAEPLEIQEGAEGVSLVPLPQNTTDATNSESSNDNSTNPPVKQSHWRSRVLSLPSYIPFGQLYLLEKSSVEPLSASEYTRLTSVQSVLLELKDRFQSHTMKSYRSRFQKIYDVCIGSETASPIFMIEHLPHLPHIQQWLGVSGGGLAELGKIAQPLVIRTATSLVPLGWKGLLGDKTCEPFKVDVQGHGLHLCTLVRAQVNGRWCATSVEISPSCEQKILCGLQTMRIRIGAPLQSPPSASPQLSDNAVADNDGKFLISNIEGLNQVTLHISTDFMTSSKNVSIRVRRVRLLGLEGAGKTSLYYALMGQGGGGRMNVEGIFPDMEWREGISCGVSYIDAAGVNLQDLKSEREELKQELYVEIGKKIDMVLLVHNLAHKIPRLRQQQPHQKQQQQADESPAAAFRVLLDEIEEAGIPVVLALTNKYGVSGERRAVASVAVMDAYKVAPPFAVVVNSCPYIVHGGGENIPSSRKIPMSIVQMPFRRKEEVVGVEGVKTLQALVHSVLLTRESEAFEDFGRAMMERERRDSENSRIGGDGDGDGDGDGVKRRMMMYRRRRDDDGTAAAIGAAIGAGVGVFVAIVMGAVATFPKPP